jgi:hypothetical protein
MTPGAAGAQHLASAMTHITCGELARSPTPQAAQAAPSLADAMTLVTDIDAGWLRYTFQLVEDADLSATTHTQEAYIALPPTLTLTSGAFHGLLLWVTASFSLGQVAYMRAHCCSIP